MVKIQNDFECCLIPCCLAVEWADGCARGEDTWVEWSSSKHFYKPLPFYLREKKRKKEKEAGREINCLHTSYSFIITNWNVQRNKGKGKKEKRKKKWENVIIRMSGRISISGLRGYCIAIWSQLMGLHNKLRSSNLSEKNKIKNLQDNFCVVVVVVVILFLSYYYNEVVISDSKWLYKDRRQSAATTTFSSCGLHFAVAPLFLYFM